MRFKGGHAWSLKGQCRFCRMTAQTFMAEGEPGCRRQAMAAPKHRNPEGDGSESHTNGPQ